MQSAFMNAVSARGYLHQCSDAEGLDTLMAEGKPIAAYIGFDCTADSLHIGSLVPIMLLRLLQNHGHKPIILMGGGTTKIGDPSGKDETRRLLNEETIASNQHRLSHLLSRFLTFGTGPNDAIMLDNADWLDDLDYIPFLRDVGRHFSVNRMLGLESVKLRLEREQNLSFLEFNYMILQAYDFLELARRHDCRLQMGGSDQWGNIIGGIELARRMDNRALFGLTTPLIATASGAKMGKTAKGAVWLDGDRLSPYDYWQFWRNTEDADVICFLKLFTEVPLEEIVPLENLDGTDLNQAKEILAWEATKLCHGEDAARQAAQTAAQTFGAGGVGVDLPQCAIHQQILKTGLPAYEIFYQAGLATSKSEAKRLIRGGGGRINGQPITDEMQLISLNDLLEDGYMKISAGKKRHAVVKLTNVKPTTQQID